MPLMFAFPALGKVLSKKEMVPTSLKLLKSLQGSNHLPHQTHTSYTICRAQCKMKMWGFLFKCIKNSKTARQSIKPSMGPFWAHVQVAHPWSQACRCFKLSTSPFCLPLESSFMPLAPNTWQKVFLLPLIFALNLLCILESKYLDRNLDSTPTGLYTHRNDA